MGNVTPLPNPGGTVAMQVLATAVDSETLDLFHRVVPGGRQGLDLRQGGAEAVLAALREGVRPALLIVDISEEDQPAAAVAAVHELAGKACPLICIGTENDVGLFRALIASGATDYLTKPLKGSELRRTLLTAQAPDAEADKAKSAKVGVFIGSRGGVGTTLLAVGTAFKSAGVYGKQTALVDLDIHFGTAAMALDLEPGSGLRNALEHADRVDGLFVASALVNYSDNLAVMSGEEAPEHDLHIDADSLKRLVEELRAIKDVLIFDLPRHLVPVAASLLSTADAIHIVTDLSLAAMRDTLRLREILAHWAPDVTLRLIVNRVGMNAGGELPLTEFERGVGLKAHDKLAEDRPTGRALMQGRSLAKVLDKGKPAQLIGRLAQDLIGDSAPAKTGLRLFGRKPAPQKR